MLVLRLILSWDGRNIAAAEVVSERLQAARMLLGQTVEGALDLVPRLFSLCGQAQGVAVSLAACAARGEVRDAALLRDDSRRVALEAIVEHLWRLLLDWPPMFGLPARKDEFLRWRKRLLAVNDQGESALLGHELGAWLAAESSLALESAAPVVSGTVLPMLSAGEWAREVVDEAFSRRPVFAGVPAETGALARRFAVPEVAGLQAAGQCVAARLAARYADLRFLASALVEPQRLAGWLDAAQVAENIGLARVETARGLLLHLMQVKDGRVGGYVIVAPTEWNFHPQGAFVREITGCPAPTRDAAELAARRLALALDPCVAYEIVINRVETDA